MKNSPDETKLLNRLKPSKFSGEGFLGDDERPLNEIIAEDLSTLEKENIDKEVLVSIMKEVYEKAKDALGAEVNFKEGVKVLFYESMGRVPSPFQGDGVFEKGEAVVTDNNINKSLIITALGIHLIEKYSFFQGKGSHYRMDPLVAIEILMGTGV